VPGTSDCNAEAPQQNMLFTLYFLLHVSPIHEFTADCVLWMDVVKFRALFVVNIRTYRTELT
jgi:hypothetical protein